MKETMKTLMMVNSYGNMRKRETKLCMITWMMKNEDN